MSQPENRDGGPGEAPLDPEAQRIQAKLKRLLLGSSLVMIAGFIAVFAAILYKINSNKSDLSDAPFAATIAVGADADILQVSTGEGMLLVLVREGSKTALLRLDPVTGKELGRTDFVAR
ncbi:hypothetical protein [Roseibium sediminicola]|uniref:Flagellar protein FliO/FliZ n=1 Tax=Roseibium sediminicola TaxID=2933272 RepID=A0ABT0GWN6_9HYPH|nr:hypothetical protein [Roseibium sp. CAU 1639]MCK7613198.1 hypothetical protein [Roseibium sp. CAU 1639]